MLVSIRFAGAIDLRIMPKAEHQKLSDGDLSYKT